MDRTITVLDSATQATGTPQCGTCGGPVLRVAAEPWERAKLRLPAWAHAAGSQDHTATLAVSVDRVYRSGLPSQHAVKIRYSDGLGATVTLSNGRVSWADLDVWSDPGAYMLAPWYCPGHNGSGVCAYGACDYIRWTGPDLTTMAEAFEAAQAARRGCRCSGCRFCDPCCCTNIRAVTTPATQSAARLARYARGDVRYRLQG